MADYAPEAAVAERPRLNATEQLAQLNRGNTAALARQRLAAEQTLRFQIDVRERRLAAAQIQLRGLAAACDVLRAEAGERQAKVEELENEVQLLKGQQRTDRRDLILLAGRALLDSRSSGKTLDAATVEIFRRRRWNTKLKPVDGQRS